MKAIRITFVALALLPFVAEAANGSVHSGAPAARGGNYSAPSRGSYSYARPVQPKPVAPARNVRSTPARTNSSPRSWGGQTNVMRQRPGSFVRPAPGSVPVGATHHIDTDPHHHRSWWGGGIYFGTYYGPGWYPWLIYPGYWYGNGWIAYQYEYAPYNTQPGIKFDLGQISGADRKAVEDAGVYLPTKDGKDGYLGAVKNFEGMWHKALPFEPGTYDIHIALADGREIEMNVTVQPQRVTKVTLRLDKAPPENEQSADASATPKSGQPQ